MTQRRTARILTAVLVGVVLLILISHLVLVWRFDTSHMQQRLEAMVAERSDSLYRVRIGRSHFSLLGRSFQLADLELFPDTAAITRRDKAGGAVPHTRYLVTAASLRVEGLALWRLFRGQLSAPSADVDSLRLEIRVDRTLPRSPDTPARLPHQVLQESPPLHIDQLRVAHSQIHFMERAIDGSRFATLPFTELEAVITNVTADPFRMSPAHPCEINVRARFAGASPMLVRLEYDLSAKRLNLAYHVSFGRMNASALNQFLVDLEGVRIREGQLDSAVLKADVRDDLARGDLLLLYHDLEVETLDKISRDRSLQDKVQTFIFNNFKLRTKNPPDDKPPVRAAIQLRRMPETPLFKFLWLNLRAGVVQTLGI
jgi:uncharacterized protein DUF748